MDGNVNDTRSGKKIIETCETLERERTLEISWSEKIKNDKVYLRMNEQKTL